MFARYWDGRLAIIAIVAVAILAIGYLIWHESARLTEQRIRDEQRTEYHIQYAEDRIDQNCLPLEGMALRDCIHEEIETARDHDRAEGDLDAQQVMARFTRVMGYTGLAGIGLGLASVALILMTLWETSAGVAVMRQEQRPWLHIEGVTPASDIEVKIGSDHDKKYIFFRGEVTVQCHNSGKTAAKAVAVDFEVFGHEHFVFDSLVFEENRLKKSASRRLDGGRGNVSLPGQTDNWDVPIQNQTYDVIKHPNDVFEVIILVGVSYICGDSDQVGYFNKAFALCDLGNRKFVGDFIATADQVDFVALNHTVAVG